MAKSILDIVIRTMKQGGADKETIKGMVSMKGAVTSAMGAFAALAAVTYAVDKALDATVGKAVEYANKVEGIANATGMSADASSRTIQVLDDLRVSYEDLSASVKKNADVTDFSIDGLAALSGEYQALTGQTERQAFAQEHFGKQWVEFIKVMDAGPEKLRSMSAAMQENLIATEASQTAAKEYQENLDNLNDKWEGLSITVGNKVIPVLNNMMDSIERSSTMTRQQSTALVYLDDALADGRITVEEYDAAITKLKIPLEESADAMSNASESAEILAVDYDTLLGSIQNMQSETDRYNETQTAANEAIAQANSDFAAGNIDIAERDALLAENGAKLDENAAAHERWAAQTVFAFAQARAAADGEITQGEGEVLIAMGVQLGLFDQKTADTMAAVNSAFSTLDVSSAEATIGALKGSLEALTGKPWVINVTTTTTGSLPKAGTIGGYATGGAFDAGQPMLVHKDEVMVPDYGGVVLTRTDAMRLMGGQGNGDNSKRTTIYGLTIYAQGSVMDELASLK